MSVRKSVGVAVACLTVGAVVAAAPQRGRAGQPPPPPRPPVQTPPPRQQTPVFRAGVELVQVDVVVRDSSGLSIHGLTADDFVVLDRGKPQSIVTFKAERRERAVAAPSFASHFPATTRLDVSSNQTAQAGRLIILVLDDLHAYRGRDETVKTIARGIVEDLGADSLMALLMTSGNFNVEVTEDRSRVLAAIDRFKGARAVRRPMQAVDNRRGPNADLQEFDANMRLYNTLESAARLFSASDGRRKAFVLVSENLAKDVSGVLQVRELPGDQIQGGEAYIAGNLEGMNVMPPLQTHAIELLEALESMRKSNVVTYAIDPRGHVSSQDLMRECMPAFGLDDDPCVGAGGGGPPSFTSWVRLAQRGLEHIAGASGGFAIVDTNDFTGGIDRIIDDLDNYYLLGFYTEDSKSRGYRRLEVQVRNRPELQLRYRRGYEIGAEAGAEPKNKDPLFALTAGALPKANVPLRLGAVVLPGSGKDARVPVAIEVSVPRQSMEEADARLRDQIRYAVTVVDMKGAKVREANGYGANLVLRPRAQAGPAPDTVTYQIGLALNLPPGRYHLRASASSSKLSDGGSVYLPVDVPDYTKERVAVSGLMLGYGSGPRVPAVASAVSPAQRLGNRLAGIPPPARGSPPPVPGGVPFPPTLDREFHVTDDVVLYFEVARRDRAREVAIDVMAVDADERVVRRYGQKLPAASAGKVTVRLPLRDIGPGAYRLRAYASDGVNDASNEVAIIIK